MTKKLIFVHNANSGMLSMMLDGLHKNFKPSTYQCQLCTLTYGRVSMKNEWKDFTKALPYQTEFLHKDQLIKRYPKNKDPLPAVYFEEKDSLSMIITANEFDGFGDLEDLMKAVKNAI